MKIAISSYSFAMAVYRGEMTNDDIIPKASELGFDGIEFAGISTPTGMAAADYAKQLSERAAESGIEIVCYSTSADFVKNPVEDEVKRLKEHVDIAAALGAGLMRHDVYYGQAADKYGEKSFPSVLPRLVCGAKSVTEYAEGLGIKTTVENHGFYCQDSERVEALVDRVGHKNYGALIDLGNFLCVDEDPAKAVGRLKDYAFYVHVKDFFFRDGSMPAPCSEGWICTRGGNYIKGAAIGDGIVPIEKCLKILKKSGYDGWLTIEYEGREDVFSSIKAGKKHLEELLGRI